MECRPVREKWRLGVKAVNKGLNKESTEVKERAKLKMVERGREKEKARR